MHIYYTGGTSLWIEIRNFWILRLNLWGVDLFISIDSTFPPFHIIELLQYNLQVSSTLLSNWMLNCPYSIIRFNFVRKLAINYSIFTLNSNIYLLRFDINFHHFTGNVWFYRDVDGDLWQCLCPRIRICKSSILNRSRTLMLFWITSFVILCDRWLFIGNILWLFGN